MILSLDIRRKIEFRKCAIFTRETSAQLIIPGIRIQNLVIATQKSLGTLTASKPEP